MNFSKIIICLFVFTFMFQSCRKDIDIESEQGVIKGPSTLVVSSVFGVVRDLTGAPVGDASVSLSNHSTFTDENGVFRFDDVKLVKDYEVFFNDISDNFPEDNISRKLQGSYVKVEKDGYFLGSRRFYPEVGKTSNIEIDLLPEVLVGSFDSGIATSVSFNDVELSFGSDAVVDAKGDLYSGQVEVYASYLDPTKIEVLNSMPGDLTGINEETGLVSLSSFGMIAVELKAENGDPLQVAENEVVRASFPVPASLLGLAPNSIPLWSFQEEEGIWINEGEAELQNGFYVGNLPHFSFWNCDIPFPSALLEGNISSLAGGPLANVWVKLVMPSTGLTGAGYTNGAGDFTSHVPTDEILILEIYNHCGELAYASEIGPFTGDSELNLIVDEALSNVFIYGQVTSCLDPPSASTYVQASINNRTQYLTLDELNQFSENILYCTDDETILIRAIDPISSLVSDQQVMNLEDSLNFSEVEICDSLFHEHVLHTYGGNTYYYLPANGSLVTQVDSIADNTTGLLLKYVLTTMTISNVTGDVITQVWVINLDELIATYTLYVYEEGFSATGILTSQIVLQDGVKWLIMSGTLDEIEILDSTLYDPINTEVEFHLAVQL